MSSKVALVAALSLLGFSLALPAQAPLPYNPQDFYQPSHIIQEQDASVSDSQNFDTLPMEKSDGSKDVSRAIESQDYKPDLEKAISYNPQDFYAPNFVSDPADGSRIVGGWEAPPGSVPYMVALVIGQHLSSLVCGGSVVSRRRVLTAAHCIDPLLDWWTQELMPTARGQVGSNSLSSGYSVVRFSGHLNHPEWNPWLIKNDVGLLTLEEGLQWTADVRPVAIDFKLVRGGEDVLVNGFGRLSASGVLPDRLQSLRVRALSPKQCEKGVREAQDLWGASPHVDPKVELCTFKDVGRGLCNGDSGSALTVYDRLVATVSWGWACALGHPDVHARVSGFQDWLQPLLKKELDDEV